MRTIGEIIKTERKKAGFTQQELADLMGVSKSCVSRWEKDSRTASIEDLAKLSTCLGVNLLRIITEEFEHEIFNPVPAHKGRKVAMVKRIRPKRLLVGETLGEAQGRC